MWAEKERKMKPKAGTEVFELIPSQKMINFMLKYSFFHKQVIQIPMSIVTHTPIDFDVLKKALNIEIERNDCMRLRFYKEHGEFYQYFLDKYVVDDVPVVTFSTEEEQQTHTAFERRGFSHYILPLVRRRLRNIYQHHPSVHGCRGGLCVLLRSARSL